MIPVEIPPQLDQDIEQNIPVVPTRCETNHNEIPQLESDLDKEEGQFEDLQTYLTYLPRESEHSQGILEKVIGSRRR